MRNPMKEIDLVQPLTRPPRVPEKSIDLVMSALEGGDTGREIARKIGFQPNLLHVSRTRGRLSPTAAGTLAAHIGLDPVLWTALAALEAEPATVQRDTLISEIKRRLKTTLTSSRVALTRTALRGLFSCLERTQHIANAAVMRAELTADLARI